MSKILVGISGADSVVWELMQPIIRLAIPEESEIFTTEIMDEFEKELHSDMYETVICLEHIGNDYGFMERIIGYGMEKLTCLFILPNRQSGDMQLEKYVRLGFNRFLFLKDTNVESVVYMLAEGYQSVEDTLEYFGLYFRPVKVETVEETVEEPQKGTQITRKYLANGLAVTTLCAKDVKKLAAFAEEEDPVLAGVLSNQMDLERPSYEMSRKEFPVDEDWVQRYKGSIRQYYRTQGIMTLQSFENGDIKRPVFERHVIKELMRQRLTDKQAMMVCESFMKDVLSYGRLDDLITTEDVTDVRLMNKDIVNVQYKGTWYRTNISFPSEEEYNSFISRMCTINHSAINLHEPETIFTDIKTFPNLTLRVTVTHGILNTYESFSAHIRIATKNKKTVETLISDGFMNWKQAKLLIDAVQLNKSLVICGGSGSGKTILLNMLIEYFDPSINGICVQESDELHSESHRNISFLHSIAAKGEGSNGYSLKELATSALTKGAEMFIIGEIKGDEAQDFLSASRTIKVYCTTHAEDFTGAIPRLTELAKTKANYSQDEVKKILAKNINYVVYCEKYRCKQIAKVVGYDEIENDVIYDLYDFDAVE